MAQSNRPTQAATLNLTELKRRLDQAQEVVVDQTGHLHRPDSPEVKDKAPSEKTTVKPSRWF